MGITSNQLTPQTSMLECVQKGGGLCPDTHKSLKIRQCRFIKVENSGLLILQHKLMLLQICLGDGYEISKNQKHL